MNRKSIFTPLAIILAGVLLQLYSMGILGKGSAGVVARYWPLLIIAIGVDLLFCEKRILGAVIVLFSGVALFIYSTNSGAPLVSIWNLFVTFWPVLLILYGIDSLLTGKSLANSIIAIIIVLILVYAVLGALGVPIFTNHSIPVISELSGKLADKSSTTFQQDNVGNPTEVPSINREKTLSYAVPSQPCATFEIHMKSGNIKVASEDLDNRILSGSIALQSGEILEENAEQTTDQMVYSINSVSPGSTSGISNWNLKIGKQKPVSLTIEAESGYELIDLRGINLIYTKLTNLSGNIDVMLSNTSNYPVYIGAKSGNIRVYVPANVKAIITVSGTDQIVFPDSYTQSGNTIYPSDQTADSTGLPVDIQSMQGGSIQIIENLN